MNYGKINPDIHERTVHKAIQNNSCLYKEYFRGLESSPDCSVWNALDSKNIITSQAESQMFYGTDYNAAVRALAAALNNAAINGAEPGNMTRASFFFLLPQRLREIKLRRMIEAAAGAADNQGVLIDSVQAQTLLGVETATVICSVHAIADKAYLNPNKVNPDKKNLNKINPDKINPNKINPDKAEAGESIIMTKWAALEGSAILANAFSKELKGRYPVDMVETAGSFEDCAGFLMAAREAALAVRSGASSMQTVREGGIFGALWLLAQKSGVGLVIDLKKIPIRQETIEVCEFFDLNPYEMLSGASLLITSPDGQKMLSALRNADIPAEIIGYTSEGNDRLVRNGETRYLELPRGDEIYKISWNDRIKDSL